MADALELIRKFGGEPRDLTPAAATHDTPYGASEARAEVEAFMGEGWTVITSYVVDDGDLHVVAERDGVCVDAYGPTYRAAVDALKAAWRDAVRPWCVQCANEGHNAVDRHGNIVEGAGSIVARVLKEDSK